LEPNEKLGAVPILGAGVELDDKIGAGAVDCAVPCDWAELLPKANVPNEGLAPTDDPKVKEGVAFWGFVGVAAPVILKLGVETG